MKLFFIIFATIAMLVLLLFVVLAHQSKTLPKLGLHNGQLAPCMQPGNCVNSTASSSVSPIPFSGTNEEAWQKMVQAVTAIGGKIERQERNYLWASFETPLFGFVDDLELLMEPERQQFQIRSASRVGRSDFSANLKRVERIRAAFAGQ